jgi:GntR family transcriptional regulator
LFLRIESSSSVPITRQIAEQIRAMCANRVLKPGVRLPSVRQLAQELAVNQNTILRVYERLTMEGLLDRRHGDGTFVADELPAGQMKKQRDVFQRELRALIDRAGMLGIELDELHDLIDAVYEAARSHGNEAKSHVD